VDPTYTPTALELAKPNLLRDTGSFKFDIRDGELIVSPSGPTTLLIKEHDYATPPVPGITWYWVLVEDMGRFIYLHN
jgi:hypothetical protein